MASASYLFRLGRSRVGIRRPNMRTAITFSFIPSQSRPLRIGTGLVVLVAALSTDFEWLCEHTRYLRRALEWDAGRRQDIRCLSGSDIVSAWIAGRPPGELEADWNTGPLCSAVFSLNGTRIFTS